MAMAQPPAIQVSAKNTTRVCDANTPFSAANTPFSHANAPFSNANMHFSRRIGSYHLERGVRLRSAQQSGVPGWVERRAPARPKLHLGGGAKEGDTQGGTDDTAG